MLYYTMKNLHIKETLLACTFAVMSGTFAFADARDALTIANPLDLNYRFSKIHNEPPRREAADPEIVIFKDRYYLFASKSGGYWSSSNLVDWKYIPCSTLPIENYAPTAAVIGDKLYFFASGADRFFASSDPESGIWQAEEIKTDIRQTDPDIFVDDDGSVYVYWGCSNKDPIMGAKVDPANGFKIVGTPKVLVSHNYAENGWEKDGNNNQNDRRGWNEGANVIKHNGKYYLQYAAPGTQYRLYADGVYVSDSPLGEFKYEPYSPFSIKRGGFIGGAGHGATFKDKFGNYWHIASMLVGVRHGFERRLGLFPSYFDKSGALVSQTEYTDRPFFVPQKKLDFAKKSASRNWNVLSFEKSVKASSEFDKYAAKNAADEKIETWWSAESGNVGERLEMDLGAICKINAMQINFADQDINVYAEDNPPVYKYIVEVSNDGKNWKTVWDKSENTSSKPHEFFVLKSPLSARYVAVKNTANLNGKFSISDLRIFGTSPERIPAKVENFKALRDEADLRNIELVWDKSEGADGYILRYGIEPNKLNLAWTIRNAESVKGSFLNKKENYFFTIEPFNGAGVGKATSAQAKLDK